MICLIDTRSRLSIATIVFYTCIWIPIKQMKQAILGVVSSIHHLFHRPKKGHDVDEPSGPGVVDLPAAKFQEAAEYYSDGDDGGSRGCLVEVSCSICLAEYQREDMVSRLPRCGHVSHMDCIKSWLDKNQFTCPLCRDLFLHAYVHAR